MNPVFIWKSLLDEARVALPVIVLHRLSLGISGVELFATRLMSVALAFSLAREVSSAHNALTIQALFRGRLTAKN